MENEEKVDITKFPEGFNEVIKSLNFLPDDYAARYAYLLGITFSLMTA
jgi:hypothetical protein